MPRRSSAQGSFALSVQPLNRRKQPDVPHLIRYATRIDESCREATVAAMADGEISPDEAAVVAGVLEIKRRAIETVEIERRIAALEERKQ